MPERLRADGEIQRGRARDGLPQVWIRSSGAPDGRRVRIAVAGSRDGVVTHAQAVTFGKLWRELDGTGLLHGCCPAIGTPETDGVPERMRGVDAWVGRRAIARGIPVEHFPPLQASIGWPACGPERNRRMVRAADAAIVFPGGAGTASTARWAADLGKPLYEITGDGRLIGPA